MRTLKHCTAASCTGLCARELLGTPGSSWELETWERSLGDILQMVVLLESVYLLVLVKNNGG